MIYMEIASPIWSKSQCIVILGMCLCLVRFRAVMDLMVRVKSDVVDVVKSTVRGENGG